jgi:hypothetical protein
VVRLHRGLIEEVMDSLAVVWLSGARTGDGVVLDGGLVGARAVTAGRNKEAVGLN